MRTRLKPASLLAATILIPTAAVSALVAGAGPAAAAISPCDAMKAPVYHVVNPGNQASLYTSNSNEALNAAAKYKFTEDHGVGFKASTTGVTGLTAARRLFNGKTSDFEWALAGSEADAITAGGAYVDQGVNYYTSPTALSCTSPVLRYVNARGMHRFAVTAEDQAALVKAGWTMEKVAFYAVPAVGDPTGIPAPPTTPPTTPPVAPESTKFTIADYPDTQQEVGTDSRFIDRSKWVAANKDALNIKFVNHTGDVVNWDTDDHAQYAVAQKAFVPLEAAGIPYGLSIGNHDTQATGVGGSARDPQNTRTLQRDTHVFNDYFKTAREGAVAGQFEAGKVDNVYSTFNAGNEKWLVLDLELWPRFAVVDWAKNVVATHPDYNVVISSHNLVQADGSIAGTNTTTRFEYGDASPRYVYDNLILAYPNVRLTLSGHLGNTAERTDTGKAGNKVVSLLATLHSNTDNPLRLITVDTATNTFTTKVFGVKTGNTYEASNSFDQMNLVGGPVLATAKR